jgi:transposase
MTTHCGVDFHARSQTVRFVSDADGEIHAVTLDHERDDLAAFYASLPGPVIVGLESHGYTRWFEQLLCELGCAVWVGDAARIRRFATRTQKNDDRDADLILELMLAGRFPRICRPTAEARAVVQLLRCRHNLVRTRTRIANSLSAIALAAGQVRRLSVVTVAGRRRIEQLPLPEPLSWQRATWLALLDAVDAPIHDADRRLAAAADGDAQVARLRTQPGVGLLTALALVHILSPVERFSTSRKVTAYVGLDPVEHSSGEHRRVGRISKQGSHLLRFLLVEAAQTAARHDPHLNRVYQRLARRKTRQIAKVAVARRLLVQSYILLRDGIDYKEFCRRGAQRRGVGPDQPEEARGPQMPDD